MCIVSFALTATELTFLERIVLGFGIGLSKKVVRNYFAARSVWFFLDRSPSKVNILNAFNIKANSHIVCYHNETERLSRRRHSSSSRWFHPLRVPDTSIMYGRPPHSCTSKPDSSFAMATPFQFRETNV